MYLAHWVSTVTFDSSKNQILPISLWASSHTDRHTQNRAIICILIIKKNPTHHSQKRIRRTNNTLTNSGTHSDLEAPPHLHAHPLHSTPIEHDFDHQAEEEDHRKHLHETFDRLKHSAASFARKTTAKTVFKKKFELEKQKLRTRWRACRWTQMRCLLWNTSKTSIPEFEKRQLIDVGLYVFERL